jgi:hypothetical protein
MVELWWWVGIGVAASGNFESWFPHGLQDLCVASGLQAADIKKFAAGDFVGYIKALRILFVR